MSSLDYRTAGESHGLAQIALVEGLPAGVTIDIDFINGELRRRQGGYGRGGRMRIEQDAVTFLSGTRRGKTIGSPITLQIPNQDVRLEQAPALTRPRPGHADLAGSLKWLTADCRETLERASARETAARVAAGALARCLLREFSIDAVGFVTSIASVQANIPVALSIDVPTPEKTNPEPRALARAITSSEVLIGSLRKLRDSNEVYCPDQDAAPKMIAAIHEAMTAKDTLGGIVEVRVYGVPPGLGSCMRWQDKLDGRLMQAVGSIQAIKGVEIGMGFGAASQLGSAIHDEIDFNPALRDTPCLGFTRRSNNAGGLEGGMTNGQPIIVRAAMKPISTLLKGLDSVDLTTKESQRSTYERSDICSVPASSVIVENVVVFEVARAFLEKFGGDTLTEVRMAYDAFLKTARAL